MGIRSHDTIARHNARRQLSSLRLADIRHVDIESHSSSREMLTDSRCVEIRRDNVLGHRTRRARVQPSTFPSNQWWDRVSALNASQTPVPLDYIGTAHVGYVGSRYGSS
jgi:hypothetical protein